MPPSAADHPPDRPVLVLMTSHWLSFVGMGLIGTALVSWLFVLPMQIRGHVDNPYIGILVFIVIPIVLVMGLAMVPVGIFLARRRAKQRLESQIADRKGALRRLAAFLGLVTVANVIVGTQVTYREDIFRFHVSWEPAPWGRFQFGYRNGSRTGGTYTEDPSSPPGLRTFDLADRDQNRYDALANFTPVERFSFGLQFHRTDDDYPDSRLGRTGDEFQGWAVDFSVDAGHGVAIWGNYGEDHTSWEMSSRFTVTPGGPGNPADNWGASPEDEIVSYGLGINATLIPDKLTLDASGTITDSTGEQPFDFAPGGLATADPTPYPDVSDKRTTLDAELRWMVKKSLDVIFAASHETWDASDFQRDVMRPWMGGLDAGAGESVFLGARVPDYGVNWVRVLLSYSF